MNINNHKLTVEPEKLNMLTKSRTLKCIMFCAGGVDAAAVI